MSEPGSPLPSSAPTSASPSVDWEPLLLAHYDRILGYIQRNLPDQLRALYCPEDILQETYAQAVRSIGRFQPTEDDAFHRWLATIARRQIINLLQTQNRVKRGGGRARVAPPHAPGAAVANSMSYDLLLSEMAVTHSTPSRGAARHEAVAAMHLALAQLKEDMRQAVVLRYIEGQSVSHTAKIMDRTERAVQMLCHRALRTMRATMGRASTYMSSAG